MIAEPLEAKVGMATDPRGLKLTFAAGGSKWKVCTKTAIPSAAEWRRLLTHNMSAVHFDGGADAACASIYAAGEHYVFSVSDREGVTVAWSHPRHLCLEAIREVAAFLAAAEKRK